jgi:hypothetical protein
MYNIIKGDLQGLIRGKIVHHALERDEAQDRSVQQKKDRLEQAGGTRAG